MYLDSIQNNVQSTAERSQQTGSIKTTADPAAYTAFMVISIEDEVYQLDDGSKWQVDSPKKIGLGDKIELIDSNTMRKMETGETIKTTLIDLPRLESNVIEAIQWVYWGGERQPLITLKDGSQWFFDEFASAITFWQAGDQILAMHSDNNYYLINIDSSRRSERLANYSLDASTDTYTIGEF